MNLQSIVEALGELNLVWPDAATAAAHFEKPLVSEELRAWRRLLRKTFGAEVLTVGHAIFGRGLELSDLTALTPDLTAWKGRVNESRGLAPLLASIVKTCGVAPTDYSSLKSGALKKGLQPSAWKWLCAQRPSVVRKLFSFGWTPEAVFWSNLLARALPGRRISESWLEAGRPYGYFLQYQILSATNLDSASEDVLSLERLFRLLPSEASIEKLTEYEALSVGMLMSLQNNGWSLAVKPGMTWTSALRRVREYNETRARLAREVAALKEDPSLEVNWKPYLGEATIKGVSAKEITGSRALEAEGIEMTHCVGNGTYVEACLGGTQAIFSLCEPTTKSRATLQLRRAGGSVGKWSISQLAGFGNSAVPQMFWRAARDLQTMLSEKAVAH